MRKKMSQHIEALISKNSELYNDNVALSKELENQKVVIKVLQNEIEELKAENNRLKESASVTMPVFELNDLAKIETENDSLLEEVVPYEVKNEDEEKVFETPVIDAKEPEIINEICLDAPEAIISASSVIGKIVLECAELCNLFTKEGGQNAKDLVNLALGRTEVFKSEILQLVTEYSDFNEAKAEVDVKVAAIREYFDLLKKQL